MKDAFITFAESDNFFKVIKLEKNEAKCKADLIK